MASRFSSVRQFMENKANQNREDRSVDSLVKQAQLKELGYDYQPRSKALGIFGGGADIVQNPNYVSTKDYERQKMFGEIQKGELERKKLEQEIGGFGQALPDGFVRVQGKVVRDPNFMTPYQRARSGGDSLTPGQRLAKDKATQELFGVVEQNKIRRTQLEGAKKALPNVPQGFGGRLQVEFAKRFNPNDPMLADWQKIKMIGTDAQLLNTAMTKGAISDREMALFAQAAANDDIISTPRLKPILQKLEQSIAADEAAKFGAYQKNYGEDPRTWFGQGAVQPEPGGVEELAKGKIDYARAKADGWKDDEIKAFLIEKGLI